MKNKTSHSSRFAFLFAFVAGALMYLGYAVVQGETNNIEVATQSLANNFSSIHFNAGGNDFWGGALWVSTQEKLPIPKEIKTENGSWKFCTVKLEGIYYNSQRGERLRPLDENTLNSLKQGGNSYDDMKVEGGLYTSCWTGDEYSIYGLVTHKVKNEPDRFVIAGVNYSVEGNKMIKNSPLNCTLQLLNNKTPVWYLYDYQGGIGFVGANVPSEAMNVALATTLASGNGNCINTLFQSSAEWEYQWTHNGETWTITNQNSLENLKWNLAIRGVIGLTNDLLNPNKIDIEGNFGAKSQTIRTTSYSLADAVNVARKKAEQLCRGKWNTEWGKVLCYDNSQGAFQKELVLEQGKTYILKNIDLKLRQFMKASDEPVTVFIDGGKLLLPTAVNTGTSLISFNDAGYLAKNGDAVSDANYLRWNFIINGLVASHAGTAIQNKLYVHGKFLSLNTYDTPTAERVHHITSLLSAGNFDENLISYRDLFAWRCENMVQGIASDGTSCKKWKSEFSRAPLSVIDLEFSSPLLN